jgi:hypothetical protein
MKTAVIFAFTFLSFTFSSFAQDKGNLVFWEELSSHCGKAYEGVVTSEMADNDPFSGKRLIMHVADCGEEFIHIPFFVGDDKSRTWVLTMENDLIKLKHDHRHEDGSQDKITQYGGTSPNTGMHSIQIFPADQETADLIPYAANNVWWITLDDDFFTYNLRRIGTERLFTVQFDLKKEVESPGPAWGWE